MIVKEFIDVGKHNRPGTAISPKFVTIHNTSNTSRGADAKAHSKFVRNTGFYTLPNGTKNWVSWHFTVDDAVTIQHLPISEKGFHAGSGNSKSIGVEICMNVGIDQQKAFRNAAVLVGSLLRDLGLATATAVRTHESWTGKSCPVLLLGHAAWTNFLAMVETERTSPPNEAVVDPSEIEAVEEAPDAEEAPDGEEFDLDHDLLLESPEYQGATS